MKIQILMSTYNGGDYIRTQLDSMIAQDAGGKTLLIRDDGSTDHTVEMIKEYQAQHPWISYYKGENIGVQRSFLELMSQADETADYIAFADQDDEWLPDKLSRAVQCLEEMKIEGNLSQEAPLLYCSDKQIVGKNLEPLNVTVSRVVRKISFGNALVQNICTGCTAVANRALIDLIKRYPPKNPEHIVMHDWWLYLTASCFGEVYYDQEAHIRYRQHGGNTSGAMINRRRLLLYRMNQLMEPRGEIYRQAEAFGKCYSEKIRQPEFHDRFVEVKKLLSAEKGWWNRLRVACDRNYFRQKRMDDLIFRWIILLGKL